MLFLRKRGLLNPWHKCDILNVRLGFTSSHIRTFGCLREEGANKKGKCLKLLKNLNLNVLLLKNGFMRQS